MHSVLVLTYTHITTMTIINQINQANIIHNIVTTIVPVTDKRDGVSVTMIGFQNYLVAPNTQKVHSTSIVDTVKTSIEEVGLIWIPTCHLYANPYIAEWVTHGRKEDLVPFLFDVSPLQYAREQNLGTFEAEVDRKNSFTKLERTHRTSANK